MAVAGPKRGTGVDTPVAGVKGVAAAEQKEEEDDAGDHEDDGGFLSFGTAGDMEVDT